MDLSNKLKNFKILFENKEYDKIIDQINKIEKKDSKILNIFGAAFLLRNNKNKRDKISALNSFEKAYLIDKKTSSGLNALCNFMNIGLELGKFSKIFEYYEDAKSFFGEDEKLLEVIQRAYLFQNNVIKRDKILKKLIDKKSQSIKIWSSYLYNKNFLSEIKSQKYHFDLAKDFENLLIDFNLPNINLNKNIRKRKIKIAFLSSDLNNNHSVTYFLKGLLQNIDKSKFHITAIANWRSNEFSNKQISPYFDHWFSINKYRDLEAIKLIRSQCYDVIFDIMGMTSNNRPTLFKNRIAPIQINWLGYCNTAGIKNMDFIFSDENLIDKKEEKFYFEKVKKFKNIWNCHSGYPFKRKLTLEPPLKQKKFTYGSFNNFNKISKENLNCWEKILKQNTQSQLVVKTSTVYSSDFLKEELRGRGIIKQVIILKKSNSYLDHLNLYDKIDLALDTFPYTGVTTTFDSLWKNVPVLTLKGYNFKSRCGYSIIKNLNIDYLVANNADEYVSKALYLSKDKDYLKTLRKDLFIKLANSKLFDTKSFAVEFQSLVMECIEEKLQCS